MMNISTRTRESAIVWFDYAYLMMIHCDEYQDEAVRARTREPAIVQLLMQLFDDDTFFMKIVLWKYTDFKNHENLVIDHVEAEDTEGILGLLAPTRTISEEKHYNL